MKLYLEISSMGPACNKSPFESFEKTLLTGWARESPDVVRGFLIEENCITMSKKTETYDDICNEIYKKHSMNVNDPSQFSDIEEKVVSEFKKRKESHTPEQMDQVKTFVNDTLKKDCGKNNETAVLKRSKNLNPEILGCIIFQ